MLATSVLAVLSGSANPEVAAAATVLDRPGSASRISAFGGAIAWSRQTGRGSEAKYVLILRAGGQTRRARLPAQSEQFQVALGPSSRGQLAVVVRRCISGGCRLERYNPSTGESTAIPLTAGARLPAVWRRQLAFVRNDGRGDRVVLATLAGRQQRALARPTPNREVNEPADITGLALRGSRVLFTATTGPNAGKCPGAGKVGGSLDQLSSAAADLQPERLEVACGAQFGSPHFIGRDVAYSLLHPDGRTAHVRRVSTRGMITEAALPQLYVSSVATSLSRTYWIGSDCCSPVRLRGARLTFDPVPAPQDAS